MTIDKIKKIIASQLNINEETIKDDSRVIEDLGADSLDIVEMLMTLEEEFGINIPDEDTSNMKTVAEIADMISKKTK
jgi:acyl carrier protein